ncbi:MAG: PAS domain S-box protein [Desulfobacteraceae bacterium]|nr:PAS domain S-box protein [Desulfobacteraceae bacterium]
MRLRHILLILSLLTILSASTGGYLYYSALREAAFKEAARQAETRVELLKKNLSAALSVNIRPVEAMAGIDTLLEVLVRPGAESLNEANATLDLFKRALDVDVCYVMNHTGTTVASSNREAPDSFVGKNFAFRPYFRQAFHSAPATYLALGTTSGKRGAYYSFPIFEKGEDLPIGLAVIKASIAQIENEMGLSENEMVLVTDPQGVIFITNRGEWLYRSIHPLQPEEKARILKSRQFGYGPWNWIRIDFSGDRYAVDREGLRYQMHRRAIPNYPGWSIIYLKSLQEISRSVSGPLIRITGPIVVALCILVGIAVFLLYGKASGEINKRRAVEQALRESDERYRSLYHNTPAMLHSIDQDGRLVSVSDYWTEAMGYDRQEVIGRMLTNFFTDASRRYATETVFPEFFRAGFCKEVPYQFVRKNGQIIDVLLSAIGVRDENGHIVRSLAVSIDVTERKRAEEALKKAKEELSRYSKTLERQVRERTREISSILRYTPDMVYIKDLQGRYRLINTRYEELLGMRNEDVRGKTDFDLFPREVAEAFQRNDQRVVRGNCSLQAEERFPHSGGERILLSVKFPFYEETGETVGVGGISTDITALKKAQNQLRRLSGSIIVNQEKERAAIARELHDELGQVLTALRMDAVWLAERLKNSDPAASERALTICFLIDKNIEDIRGMAIRLRPGVLDDLGLVDALEWFTTDFEKRTGIACVFEQENEAPDLDETVATTTYRITQEALTNVARHADAANAVVTIRSEQGRLLLTVTDDGRGFSLSDLPESEGLGVAGMRERAALIGGRLRVDSSPGKGTRVELTVPLYPGVRS